MKMKGVYEQNPALGDPMSIEGQLNESGHKLDKFRQELHKYQCYLDEMDGKTSSVLTNSPNRKRALQHTNLNGASPRGSSHSHRNSGSDESLSRSASDSSVSNPVNHKQSAPGTPLPSHG